MIVTTVNSGLGNQLFQYAAGFGLAFLRKTQLVVDARFYQTNHSRKYELNRFAISARQLSWSDRVRFNVSVPAPPFSWTPKGLMRKTLRAMPIPRVTFATDRQAGFDPLVLEQPDNTVLNGYWQNANYFAHCQPELRQELSFRDTPDQTNAAMLRQIATGPSVCVHVRRTDYLNPAEVLKPCGLDYYDRALQILHDRVPLAHFYIFSDDPRWAQDNLKLPGPATFVIHNLGVNDSEDLRLMSSCQHFIIANSSFSWWGAWLSNHPAKIVIAPQRWFSGEHGNERDIVPNAWTRL